MFFKKKTSLKYIPNSGVMVSTHNCKVLIDAVHTQDINTISPLIQGAYPFDDVTLLLFTHKFQDFFTPDVVNDILTQNTNITAVMSPEIYDNMTKQKNYNSSLLSQIITFDIGQTDAIELLVDDIPMEILSMTHDSGMYAGIDNFAYRFEMNTNIFVHIGNALPTMYNFQIVGLFEKKVDYLFVPFTFLGSVEGRKVLQRINPKKVFITQLPKKELDVNDWISKSKKAYEKYKSELPNIVFFTQETPNITL